MDFLKTSSIVTDFWDLLFYPLFISSLCILEFKIIVGKDGFKGVVSTATEKVKPYIERIKQYDQLSKAAPVLIVFIMFSFLHFFLRDILTFSFCRIASQRTILP